MRRRDRRVTGPERRYGRHGMQAMSFAGKGCGASATGIADWATLSGRRGLAVQALDLCKKAKCEAAAQRRPTKAKWKKLGFRETRGRMV